MLSGWGGGGGGQRYSRFTEQWLEVSIVAVATVEGGPFLLAPFARLPARCLRYARLGPSHCGSSEGSSPTRVGTPLPSCDCFSFL